MLQPSFHGHFIVGFTLHFMLCTGFTSMYLHVICIVFMLYAAQHQSYILTHNIFNFKDILLSTCNTHIFIHTARNIQPNGSAYKFWHLSFNHSQTYLQGLFSPFRANKWINRVNHSTVIHYFIYLINCLCNTISVIQCYTLHLTEDALKCTLEIWCHDLFSVVDFQGFLQL